MHVIQDEPQKVRKGEDLDLVSLSQHLYRFLPGLNGEPASLLQFPGGHSNLTYLLRIGGREMVLRRPPFGNQVKSAHDMGREYRVLAKLWSVYAPAPRPYLLCEDPKVIGVPFYVMERRQGVILRAPLPDHFRISPEEVRQANLTLIDNLADLHMLDYERAGLADVGKPEGYVARQVTGWLNRWHQARTSDLDAMEHLGQWLQRRLPPPAAPALLHNDYKFDNLVFDPADLTRLVAVLDWEMATLGDPLMDLGLALAYWTDRFETPILPLAALGPTMMPGSLTRRELLDRYVARTGKDVTHIVFYYVFGLFKIAVIIQQIYARYARGHTADPRFAELDQAVVLLAHEAWRIAQLDRLP
ncbi:MAG TPA: phosphotransferase family protein [Gemmatales bacterium]|nr:phosphotransferase family protein [Gemmatales bacterium]HMP59968.1 phosphotransferase family protein [Gemmatales bacterium]